MYTVWYTLHSTIYMHDTYYMPVYNYVLYLCNTYAFSAKYCNECPIVGRQ